MWTSCRSPTCVCSAKVPSSARVSVCVLVCACETACKHSRVCACVTHFDVRASACAWVFPKLDGSVHGDRLHTCARACVRHVCVCARVCVCTRARVPALRSRVFPQGKTYTQFRRKGSTRSCSGPVCVRVRAPYRCVHVRASCVRGIPSISRPTRRSRQAHTLPSPRSRSLRRLQSDRLGSGWRFANGRYGIRIRGTVAARG